MPTTTTSAPAQPAPDGKGKKIPKATEQGRRNLITQIMREQLAFHRESIMFHTQAMNKIYEQARAMFED
jgi:hypothetical protein